MIAKLRGLWQEAFGDTEESLDAFFTTGFSEQRFCCIWEEDVPVSALYWFDCEWGGQKLAYLYAVATRKSHRGRGLAARLMGQTHEVLGKKGYAGAILVPGEKSLFSYYEKLGYRMATKVEEFSCVAGENPVPMTEISPEEYAAWRRKYLPEGGVLQEGATLSYLAAYGRFYKGEDFLLSAAQQDGAMKAQELLGNKDAAPGILRALNLPRGDFRVPGQGRDFAMWFPLQEDRPAPGYFGLALD